MGNLKRQSARYDRSTFRVQTRRLLSEAHDHGQQEFEAQLQEWELLDGLYDIYGGGGLGNEILEISAPQVSLLDIMPLWQGTICICGHGPDQHHAGTRLCADPLCWCWGYEQHVDTPLRSREVGDGLYGHGAYHAGGFDERLDMFDPYDRYFDMLDE